MTKDFVIEQGWERYTEDDHATWRYLFKHQSRLVQNRVCQEFIDGLNALEVAADGIPRFDRLSELLYKRTGWRIVAVPGLVPDDVFFAHLAERRFPATNWIRGVHQMAYLQEPDVFHDVFGHVPLLANPVFADYLEAYGKGGLKAGNLNALHFLARLYWYTVEFGLISTHHGLRIYGSGIVSSSQETVECLRNSKLKRVAFNLERIMRTNYVIYNVQPIYFVIDSFESLFKATEPDFTVLYEWLKTQSEIKPGEIIWSDRELVV